ncbi:hypothetical protein GCM10010174_41580 [Kutzneria viridogrisea]|uniref:DUF3887 domain-containing protein n=2 Tax=Kutzneria TaxID=43356 RepID=W5W7B8_9PSEU|nr:DUF3887 domain-containing protein [Kutzneria albida]AHH96807.1 hypothetical protein KALB_3440 [Kutzneria albida DSM 43870]MBA8927974.1 hypothetical protein [Kutzneria viridogrisea]
MASNLLSAIAEAQQRARVAEEAVREAVDRAREAGHTWQEIGELLGTSRQAAFQRFGRPVDPKTGQPMDKPALPDAQERAVQLVVDLIESRWEAVSRDFDDRMNEAVDVALLEGARAQIAGTVGMYEQMGTPYVRQYGEYTNVYVPMQFEAGERVAHVTFRANGQVAGLHVLPLDRI